MCCVCVGGRIGRLHPGTVLCGRSHGICGGVLRKVALGGDAGRVKAERGDKPATGGSWLLDGATSVNETDRAFGSCVTSTAGDISGAAAVGILVNAFGAQAFAVGRVVDRRDGRDAGSTGPRLRW